jgi:hypothetical protein
MKKTILALGIATIAAFAGTTGASAFSAPAGFTSHQNDISPVTYYGHRYYKPYYGGYGRHYGWRHGYGWKRYSYGYRHYRHYGGYKHRYW